MNYCVPPELIGKVRDIFSKRISSEERLVLLKEEVGDNAAKELNMRFERTFLALNTDKAMKSFLKKLKLTPEELADISAKTAKRLAEKNQIIDESELISIAKDALDHKYGLVIPEEKMNEIFKIKRAIRDLTDPAKGTPDGSPEKLALGMKIRALTNTINDIKEPKTTFAQDLYNQPVEVLKDVSKSYKEAGGGVSGLFSGTGSAISGTLKAVFNPSIKSVKAALDASWLFRQGLKVLSANPKTWWKQVKVTKDVWFKVFSKDDMTKMSEAFNADMVTRDMYPDMVEAKLAIGLVEDFFPTHAVRKLPGLGNLFQASDEAFTMASQGARMDLFETYVKEAIRANGSVTKEEMKGIARVVNSVTGRGGLGVLEPAAGGLNTILFSARYQFANLNTVVHAFSKSLGKPAQQIAQKNVARHLLMVSGIMGTLSMTTDVGFDPSKSTFGKARIPGTKKWVDVTGGLASYVALIGKSVEKIHNPKYKDTVNDLLFDFFKGKLAPAPGVVRDYFEGRDYSGKKPTVESALRSYFVPITLEGIAKDVEKKREADLVALSAFLEFVGFGVTEPKPKGRFPSVIDIITNR